MTMERNLISEQVSASDLQRVDGSALVVRATPVPSVDYATLGTEQFRLPAGGLDDVVHLMTHGTKQNVTVAELIKLHHQLDFARNRPEYERLRNEEAQAMQEVERDRIRAANPRAAMREARKAEIVDYVRVSPGMSKNKVYQGVGGKRSTTLELIAELVEDSGLILAEDSGLHVPTEA
jgi:DNA-directed RNA polymerase subunit H (RpoH/RPB5)